MITDAIQQLSVARGHGHVSHSPAHHSSEKHATAAEVEADKLRCMLSGGGRAQGQLMVAEAAQHCHKEHN